ncbi:MAG: hypothetical protein V2I33_23765, partial [Kangiellaceae bacterium]|nr:hypothetical protein [Kangiellaceae bacterium]
ARTRKVVRIKFELSSMFSDFFVTEIRNIRHCIPECDDPTPPAPLLTSQMGAFSPVDEEAYQRHGSDLICRSANSK